VDIPAEATAVHGITTEHAQAHGKPAALVVAELLDTLTDLWAAGVPLVVMNAAYDLTLLDREAARHGLGELTVTGPVIDPMVIDRHVDRWRMGKRTLTDLARHYQVPLGRAHSAREDALAAARVAWRIGHRHPELTELTTSELHAAQEVWHAEHAADFAAYLRRQGKPADDVSPEWPVRSRAADLAGAR
jgi:DNA polymerase-3 subunit epsilon